jgi:hypothetical protein
VAPLLRAARDLGTWAQDHPEVTASQVLDGSDARAAADALELTLDELDGSRGPRRRPRHGAAELGQR